MSIVVSKITDLDVQGRVVPKFWKDFQYQNFDNIDFDKDIEMEEDIDIDTNIDIEKNLRFWYWLWPC